MKTEKIAPRRINYSFILLTLTVLFVSGMPCQAADFYVDDDTCPYTGSGTTSNPYCSISTAISRAYSGDTVLVYPGTYSERIYMKTGVDVRSAQATKPVITSTRKTIVKFSGSDNCTLDGFILDGSGGGKMTSVAMIRIYDSSYNITISNCEIKGAATPGASSFKTGIRISGRVDLNILNNSIYNTDYAGITTKAGDSIYNSTVTIKGNTIEGNGRAGINLYGRTGYSNQVFIGGSGLNDGNLINNNGTSSAEYGSGIRLRNIDQFSFINNTIQNNRRAGILLIDSSSVSPHISGNAILDNTASGINIGGSSALTIGGNNEIYNNGISGISFFVYRNSLLSGNASSQPVTITGNNIYGNTKAGIAVLDHVTGSITIDGNTIHQNSRSGISFFTSCSAEITDNDIYGHTGAAGIFTGDWSGTSTPDPNNPPTTVRFYRSYGPVNLTIRRNKVHGNRSGMRLDHASGIITNNLIYNNSRSGIRFSGDNSSPYAPFSSSWGITKISNNTVVDNGSGTKGGGIVYNDINVTIDPKTGLTRNFYDPPIKIKPPTQSPHIIKNNITAYNMKAGIKDAACGIERDYNLIYGNNGKLTAVLQQTGGCWNTTDATKTGPQNNELFTEPLFVDRAGANYQLQAGSPAKNSGNDGNDMGAYGGSDPIIW
ncbi:MAG: right-handed parallel beta-helix repeat-containing protein [Desulfobulbaceae bacterium]|nr:right-handed parallel beta-helix repeat-containing protein [Desulfobulbaceae bacterium]